MQLIRRWAVVGKNLVDRPAREVVASLAELIATEIEPEVFTTLIRTY